MKQSVFGIAAALFCVILAGCASSVPVTVMRPAELDLNGAKTISVLPFKESHQDQASILFGLITISFNSGMDNSETLICKHLTTALTQNLTGSKYIKVIYPEYVEKSIKNGTENPADVYLTGRIDQYNETLSTSTRKEKSGEEEIQVPYYTRSVQFNVIYEIIDSHTNTIIASKTKNIKESSFENKDKNEVPSAFSIVEKPLDQLVLQITKELQPYEEKKYIYLISEDDNEPSIKTLTKWATEGSVTYAKEQFMELYEKKGTFAAGYNAAMLMQAQGELKDAEYLLKKLAAESGNKKAYTALRDIESEIIQAEKLERQIQSRPSSNGK